jgi:transcription initiation factor IIE alpha subunit
MLRYLSTGCRGILRILKDNGFANCKTKAESIKFEFYKFFRMLSCRRRRHLKDLENNDFANCKTKAEYRTKSTRARRNDAEKRTDAGNTKKEIEKINELANSKPAYRTGRLKTRNW